MRLITYIGAIIYLPVCLILSGIVVLFSNYILGLSFCCISILFVSIRWILKLEIVGKNLTIRSFLFTRISYCVSLKDIEEIEIRTAQRSPGAEIIVKSKSAAIHWIFKVSVTAGEIFVLNLNSTQTNKLLDELNKRSVEVRLSRGKNQ